MTEFVTVFDLSRESCAFVDTLGFKFSILGVVVFTFGIVGLTVVLGKVWWRRKLPPWKVAFVPLLLIWWGFFWAFVHGAPAWERSEHWRRLKDMQESGQYKVVEGQVKVLHEQPRGGHDRGDVIVVNGVEFVISYFTNSAAYHQTISHGSALREGVYARIHYADRDGRHILRVDVRDTGRLESLKAE